MVQQHVGNHWLRTLTLSGVESCEQWKGPRCNSPRGDLDAIQVCDCQAQSPKTGKQVGEASESDRRAVSLTMSVNGSCAPQV